MLGYYINNDCKSGGTGLFEYFSEIIKEIVLNRVDDIVRRYNTHEINEKYRNSIGLRLWSTTRINGKSLKILPYVEVHVIT